MKLPKRATVVLNVACLAALAWLYGGDLWEGYRARHADVAAMTSVPNVAFAGVAVAAALAAAAAALFGVARGRSDGFRGYRLAPIILVLALGVDLFFLSSSRGPAVPSAEVAALAMRTFAQNAQRRATPGGVPADPRELTAMLEELGPPPYLLHGEPAKGYALELRSGCEGPAKEVRGPAGTVVYCVSRDGTQAWVTLVGLPVGVRFGAAAILGSSEEPAFWEVRRAAPETAAPEPPAEPPGEQGGEPEPSPPP